MTKTDKIDNATFSYLELLKYCIYQFTKDDFQMYIEKWRPKIKKSALQKMPREEIEALFLSIVTETRARSLYKQQPEKFGLFAKEIKDFFNIHLSIGQLEYLERQGKIRPVKPLTGEEPPEVLTAPRAYRFDDIAALTKEDFSVPSIPQYRTQSQLISEFGWSKTLINQFLPPPVLKDNPVYKCTAPVKLWYTGDVEKAMEQEEWKKAAEKVKHRKAAAKAVETKRDHLFSDVEKRIQEISVAVISDEILRRRTLQEKREWKQSQEE